MPIKRQKIVADFETTTDPNDLRVWAVCAVDIETVQTVFLSNDIAEFFEWLKNKDTDCYFHNLKFDIEFILPYLIKEMGFKYAETGEAGTFKTLITDMGVFYSCTVYFKKMNKKYQKVTFYDSLKKLPFSAEEVAKAFDLPMRKLSIDYNAYRAPRHELTEAEKEYIEVDCKIIAEALRIQFGEGLTKMTNASDAMYSYKQIFTREAFEHYFPVFPVELNNDIRQAYKGGYVYLRPDRANKRGYAGVRLDINSLYPWAMYTQQLPYGYPVYFEGEYKEDPRFPLYIVRIRASFKLKEGYLPMIQIKHSHRFLPTEYITDSRRKDEEYVELVLTSVDLALFKEHYEMRDEIEYLCGWKFKAKHGFFTKYIDYWMRIKETSTGAKRQLAKLMLNSLYGKFATNPRNRVKVPYMNDFGLIKYDDVDKGYREPVYTCMGAFITAYAREKTIRAAQANYDRFIYADTDSLHLIGNELPDLEIHQSKLGAWKNEGFFTDSLYVRAKTYMETMEDGSVEIKCAGMPDNVKQQVTYDNFRSGSSFPGKLMPKRYPGGIVLEDTTFTIK